MSFPTTKELEKKNNFCQNLDHASRMANKKERIDTNKKISRLHWRRHVNSEKIDVQFYVLRSVISKSVLLVCSLWSVVVVVVVFWTSSESYFEFYGLVMNCKSFARVFFSFASLSLSLNLCELLVLGLFFFGGGWVLVLLLSQKLSSLLVISIVQIILKLFCALLDVFMNMRNDFKHWTWFVSLQTLHFTFKKKTLRACIIYY